MGIIDGSTSAKDAVRGLLLEIAKMQMQKGFMGLISATPGGGSLGWLGGLLGGRASGGPVQGGTPYLVNERTANSELFVPSQSGAVLNVPQAQAALRQSVPQASGAQSVHSTVSVRVEGGDLTLTDSGQIMARVRVMAVQEGQKAVGTMVRNLRTQPKGMTGLMP